jgi:F-type H+-transporting ATPase subunit gamma
MTAFKEIKKRINAIKSTRKTTSAMKMVSSAKLRKAESAAVNFHLYEEAIRRDLEKLLSDDYSSPLITERPVNNIALIAFSSDSSLCGAFNSNIARELQKSIEKYKLSCGSDRIFVYTIGKKVYESIRKTGVAITKNFENMAGKNDYSRATDFAADLITQFKNKQIDRAEMIYHHFRSAGTQELIHELLLPALIPLPSIQQKRITDEYIIEPSRDEVLKSLIPKFISIKLYTALLDSNTSEHAARMVAMQTATDNADDLVGDLTIEYNKSRQQAITNELLDLIGGSAN